MKKGFFLCFLAAAALGGCGGGGGGGASSVSLVPSAPPGGGSAESRGSDSGTINEGILAENSLLAYSRQFSGSSQQQSSVSEEVYDPQTQSSVVRAFAQATLADATATRKKGAYLIASSSYGIAQAARDLLSGIGLGNNGYSFLDTSEKQTSNRSAYLETPEGSIVNILSNPLYTRRGSRLVGGLIISPDDIKSHGWIVSDTGFDGNIDPVAGITGRGWLRKHKADIEHGYRQAAATGKVRLFYGLKSDGQTRHAAANGCKGFEQYCLGTPYSLRVKNAQGRYIDVEGAFVSTYGFAAYVLAWERMPADTHISKVFELGDACAHDLGEAGADADTGLGRLDVGCMAGRIYQASVVAEEDEIEEEDVPAVVPPPVTVVVNPTPTVTVVLEVKPTATVTTLVPEVDSTVVVVEPVLTTTAVSFPDVEETLTIASKKKEALDALSNKFSRLGVTAMVSRKEKAYVVGYTAAIYDEFPTAKEYYAVYVLYTKQIGQNIHEVRSLLSKMDIEDENSYILLDASRGNESNYEKMYLTTPENSIVQFAVNPFYVDGFEAKKEFVVPARITEDYEFTADEILIDSEHIKEHGWIVSGTGHDMKDRSALLPVHHLTTSEWFENGELIKGYRKAIATGKVRLFYALNEEQTKRASVHENAWGWKGCRYFEEYCIGVPYGVQVFDMDKAWRMQSYFSPLFEVNISYLSAAYGYGIYLTAWERMPADTHVSAIFAMGDRCTQDIGEKGPDVNTGLGRLDIGCIAAEVYKANLHPAAATLSVAAKVMTPKATVALVAGRKPEDHYVLDDAGSIQRAFSKLGVTVTVGRKEKAYVIGNCVDDWYYFLVVFGGGYRSLIDWCDDFSSTGLLDDMGLSDFTLLANRSHQEAYNTIPENSIVYFQVNPFYFYGSDDEPILYERKVIGIKIDSESIKERGWIVSGAAFEYPYGYGRYTAKNLWLQDEYMDYMEEGYRKALATGKVRLFYALNVDEEGHVRGFLNNWGSNNCKGFENYCIGVPYRYQISRIDRETDMKLDFKINLRKDGLRYNSYYLEAAYGYGVYLTAWERMPADTHISAIFAMGDRCTQDIGEEGPDAETGLGYLDVGCMAREVYQANLNPAAATLSVAFVQATVSSGQSMLMDGADSLQAQSASPSPVVDGHEDDLARQRFLDDFAQELFSDLGSLRLPGETEAGLMMGFPGDSFQGRYRPAKNVQPHYHVSQPQPRYALAGNGLGVMGIGDGEIGIFARMDGLDVSFSYSRSEDFFGGGGSGQFEFEKVGNARLMLQKQILSEEDDHSLMLGGWIRHAVVVSGKGALLGDLQGSEYGASMRYDWKRGDGWNVAATAYAARFAGGDVELAGNSFGIAASDWKWGIGVVGTYEF